jgi:hypothetical protein
MPLSAVSENLDRCSGRRAAFLRHDRWRLRGRGESDSALALELTRRNERRSIITSVRGYRMFGLGNEQSLAVLAM